MFLFAHALTDAWFDSLRSRLTLLLLVNCGILSLNLPFVLLFPVANTCMHTHVPVPCSFSIKLNHTKITRSPGPNDGQLLTLHRWDDGIAESAWNLRHTYERGLGFWLCPAWRLVEGNKHSPAGLLAWQPGGEEDDDDEEE